TPDIIPAGIGKVDGERNLWATGDIFGFLGFGRAAEVDLQTVIDIADGCSLWIAVFADGRDRHILGGVEDGADFVLQCRVHARPSRNFPRAVRLQTAGEMIMLGVDRPTARARCICDVLALLILACEFPDQLYRPRVSRSRVAPGCGSSDRLAVDLVG